MKKLPTLSIIIPTYNCAEVLKECLESIKMQKYPKEKLELIVVDAASSDETISVASEYAVNHILENPLKTGEAGKSIGLKMAKNDIVAFIDSDNILPEENWLKKMVEPFEDEEIIGSEHMQYTYRTKDSMIVRYGALMGNANPLVLFLGSYSCLNTLTGKWTEIPLISHDCGNYYKITLNPEKLPVMGANGFLVRRQKALECSYQPYYFDIDIIRELALNGNDKFAKVKTGIVHLFASCTKTFIKKQRRRIKDYFYYDQQKLRSYPWDKINPLGYFKFVIYTLLVVPLFIQSIDGYCKKRDIAWFYHIPACWITFLIYSYETLMAKVLKRYAIANRINW